MEKKIKIGLIVFGIIIILMIASSSLLGYQPEEFQQGLMIGLIFGIGLGLLIMYYTSSYENKKTKIPSKFERIFFVLFAVMGTGCGFQLFQSMQKLMQAYQVPISMTGLGFIITFLSCIGIAIVVWKRDKLQNK